jgi:hypothetical protein
MRALRVIIFFIAVALVMFWRAVLEPLGVPMLAVGAIMVFPLIYYRWFSTLVFSVFIGLLWESSTPMPFGSVALPLGVGCVLFQLLGRHQFRSNLVSRIFCAALLESIVTIAIVFKFPPQTFAGVLLQLSETMVELALACVLCPLWLWSMERLSREYFHVDLESVLKDL